MGEFQKSKNNPNKKVASMNYLAQCYAKRKMYPRRHPLSRKQSRDKPVFDEEKKDLVYNLGTAFEAMEKKKESIEQFEQIYAVDIGYKDVAAKVDKFYSENSEVDLRGNGAVEIRGCRGGRERELSQLLESTSGKVPGLIRRERARVKDPLYQQRFHVPRLHN